ncbi:glycosyltransferase [Rhabdobacter roseus]|uniref:Glycosyltransferase involved in cell wall biosynthesis n=1 Tax=Rhabdobacter roseus TaxID=1655419 RepID=A0A840U0G2_9BACT|nr:glycosyltransferase family 2 protein [Rhabdobacter roseus]MBB5285369.1 glycosyltransferase involved in cell wall biosynthesis [Rhabdobacter roseus]
MDSPLISIILATYNRSNVLFFTICSIIEQSYSNWELIVVGDCCTDNTQEVVSAFEDSRIQFINLPENFGEQSGPNNEGLKKARGPFIAFMNHDDLWFQDHLQVCLDSLRQKQADLMLAAGIIDYTDGKKFDISGLPSRQHGFHPARLFVPASNWLFRKELIQEVGFWRPARDLYLVPSHDWLERVHKLGKKIAFTEQITVLALPSSSRRNAYLDRAYLENEKYYQQVKHNSRFREQLLTQILFEWGQDHYYDEKVYLRRFFRRKIKSLLISFGINSTELRSRYTFGKGGILRLYRQRRGLAPKD